jgi:uncharacterized protein YndB with AHSA1/START domain
MNLVEKTILLACPPAEAFATFTARIDDWWPPERRHLPGGSTIALTEERFFERSPDRELPLGRVRAWEPPHRLLLDFYPGTDADHPTEVEVRFVAEEGGTRVTITHRPTKESEALWTARAPRYERSWELCLAALAVVDA